MGDGRMEHSPPGSGGSWRAEKAGQVEART